MGVTKINLRLAKTICDRQGIRMHVVVPVLCPSCNNKTLLLDLTDDKAYCYHCQKKYKSVEEIEILEDESWRRKHSKTIKDCTAYGMYNSNEPIVTIWCNNCDSEIKYNYEKNKIVGDSNE